MKEMIELTVHETECGRYRVCDQHGRRVKGVTLVTVRAGVDDAIRLSIEVIDHRDGKPRTNRVADAKLLIDAP